MRVNMTKNHPVCRPPLLPQYSSLQVQTGIWDDHVSLETEYHTQLTDVERAHVLATGDDVTGNDRQCIDW